MSDFKTIDLNPPAHTFPMTALVEEGVWRALSGTAKAVLGVLWDFHRKFPDACHPNRTTLARLAGVSEPSVTRGVTDLVTIGIVVVIPGIGTTANTYRLRWKGLRVPESKPSKRHSPYQRKSADSDVALTQDEQGSNVVLYTRQSHHYKLADGCVVRSAREMHVHDLLRTWKVPHWTEVNYDDLDIQQEGIVDFVVGPRLLIEVVGLPRTQNGARKYYKALDAKVESAGWAGWTVIRVEPDNPPGDWLWKPISDAWADATIGEAKELRQILKAAGRDTARPQLDAHIEDAESRMAKKKKPRAPVGLWEQVPSKLGGPPVTQRTNPKLCLCEAAGGQPAGEGDYFVDLEAMIDQM